MRVRKFHVYLTFVTICTGFLIASSIELTRLRAMERQGDQQWQQEVSLNERILAEKKQTRQLEEDLLRNNEALITASATGDGEAIAKLAKGNAEINEEVEKLYMELAEVTDDYETAAAAFAAELEKLNAG